jgi:membrane protease YdiL (CAAX protease family)
VVDVPGRRDDHTLSPLVFVYRIAYPMFEFILQRGFRPCQASTHRQSATGAVHPIHLQFVALGSATGARGGTMRPSHTSTTMNTGLPLRRPVLGAIACALGQFLLTMGILLGGRALMPPEAFGAVKLVAFASTILFPLLLLQVFGLWKDVGLALRNVRPEPLFLVCMLLVPLYLSAGLQQPAGSSVGGDLAIQFFNAFGEELLFRGVIFALLLRLPVWQAIVLNGVLFGAMHLLHGFMGAPWPDALRQAGLTTLGGMMFHAVRLRSGSLWLAIVLHMAKNLAVMYSAASPQMATVFQAITVVVEVAVVAFVLARPKDATRLPAFRLHG